MNTLKSKKFLVIIAIAIFSMCGLCALVTTFMPSTPKAAETEALSVVITHMPTPTEAPAPTATNAPEPTPTQRPAPTPQPASCQVSATAGTGAGILADWHVFDVVAVGDRALDLCDALIAQSDNVDLLLEPTEFSPKDDISVICAGEMIPGTDIFVWTDTTADLSKLMAIQFCQGAELEIFWNDN